jgi:hypothetical protein
MTRVAGKGYLITVGGRGDLVTGKRKQVQKSSQEVLKNNTR